MSEPKAQAEQGATPRTDAALCGDWLAGAIALPADFGRSLERENAALRARLEAPVPDVEAQVLHGRTVLFHNEQVVPADFARSLARRLAEAKERDSERVKKWATSVAKETERAETAERAVREARTESIEAWNERADALVRVATAERALEEAKGVAKGQSALALIRIAELKDEISAAQSALVKAVLEVGSKQAHIDRLMLEFCPDEMTPEQIAEWGKHQQPAAIRAHSADEKGGA